MLNSINGFAFLWTLSSTASLFTHSCHINNPTRSFFPDEKGFTKKIAT